MQKELRMIAATIVLISQAAMTTIDHASRQHA